MEIRSFLAFELPSEIKEIVSHAHQDMRKTPLDVRWVKPENIHLTIVFMGNIPNEHLQPIADAVGDVCREFGPFEVLLKGTGVFSSRRYPRVLWIGLAGDLERMSDFRDGLQSALLPFGIKQERRRFKPHLTLGRFRKATRPGFHLDEVLSKYRNLTSAVCAVHELILFKSDLKPSGAVYSKLNQWPLSGKR
jgi:2'-5' RNA ligase